MMLLISDAAGVITTTHCNAKQIYEESSFGADASAFGDMTDISVLTRNGNLEGPEGVPC